MISKGTYNFDKIVNRRNSNSMKWDVLDTELPLWVADMDFETAKEIKEAIANRAATGEYGYTIVPNKWYEAYINWWNNRHSFNIDKDWLIFCTGVVPAITTAVKAMTNVGDNVVTLTPVYSVFFNSIENNGRHPLESFLIYDGKQYNIDFDDLEEKLSRPLTTLMILCNPHNPVGRIWTAKELELIGKLCDRYNVTLISDEIHCDLTMPGKNYIPFASVSETCKNVSITCVSASKTFNLAGLQSAAVFIPNERMRNIMYRALNMNELAEPNAFAIDGVIAAYNYGELWLDELREYIADNKRYVANYIKDNLPEIILPAGITDATYLMWLDLRNLKDCGEDYAAFIRQKTGLYLSSGMEYRGINGGQGFIRINTACPRAILEEAMSRLSKAIELIK